jgi:hypothetical protein
VNLLDELLIFFTERTIRGEGSTMFTVPHGALEAVFDEHTYVFNLPEGRKQVCLRICFDMGEETIRRRYEFPVYNIDYEASDFLQMVQEVAEQLFTSNIDFVLSEIDAFTDERTKRAWMNAI